MDKTQETIGRGRRGDFNWKALSSCRRASPERRGCTHAAQLMSPLALLSPLSLSSSWWPQAAAFFDVSAATTAAAVNAAAAVRAPASHVGTC